MITFTIVSDGMFCLYKMKYVIKGKTPPKEAIVIILLTKDCPQMR